MLVVGSIFNQSFVLVTGPIFMNLFHEISNLNIFNEIVNWDDIQRKVCELEKVLYRLDAAFTKKKL